MKDKERLSLALGKLSATLKIERKVSDVVWLHSKTMVPRAAQEAVERQRLFDLLYIVLKKN